MEYDGLPSEDPNDEDYEASQGEYSTLILMRAIMFYFLANLFIAGSYREETPTSVETENGSRTGNITREQTSSKY
ncbi:conserved hypothetical protein [Ricinus communis]|uniref:Uncharacterized protein n=1 Tax=Ricinus communis TaxID=3988 RepID=B9SNM4_RICCO|nr:conserved hypothetical protein [Ricinus communis]